MTAPRDTTARRGHQPPATGPLHASASPADIPAGEHGDVSAEVLVKRFFAPSPYANASLFTRILHNLMVAFSGGHL